MNYIKSEDVYTALIVDGDKPSLAALIENTGLNIDLFKSDKKVLEEVLIELDDEERLTLNLSTDAQSTSSSSSESTTALADYSIDIKNCQLGKFGAQRSGKDQFLDIQKHS